MDKPFDTAPYFNSASFSDILIRFSGREIKAHRIFLCSRSPYFQKAIGPGAQFKEGSDGVLELHEDVPAAVEEMLRYIYTSEYPSSHQGDATWETHLDVMIAADKYSLSRLEALAYEKCEWLIRNAPQTDSVLFRLVERSWEYADRERRLSKLIASLPAVSGERFPEFFEHTALRQWIDANPDVIRPVIEKHFQSLMKLRSFREKISSDGEMALQQLDRLLAATSVLQVSQTQGGQTRPTR